MKKSCKQCIIGADLGWHHVHRVNGALPRRKSSEDWIISHGWAVELSGVGFSTWTFFTDLPPAVVFALSGRSSETFHGVDICRAAFETRFLGYDVHTLLVSNERVSRSSEQALEALASWPKGVDISTVVWQHTTGHRAA